MARNVQTVSLLLTCLLPALMLTGCGSSEQTPEQQAEAAWKALGADYLTWLYNDRPVWATGIGYHGNDDALPDVSLEAWEQRFLQAESFLTRMQDIDVSLLSRDSAVDYKILRNALELHIFRYEKLQSHRNSPSTYVSLATNCVYSLLKRNFAPLDERLGNAIARMQAVPVLLEQAIRTLDSPPRIYTEVAIGQNAGAARFYREVLPGMAADSELAEAFAASCEETAAAIDSFGIWLQDELLPRSDGPWQLGAENYDAFLPLLLDTEMSAAEVLQRAETRFAETRVLIETLCRENWSFFLPDQQMPEDPEALMTAVFDAIASEHTSPDNVVQQIRDDVQIIKAFIREADIIPLPEPDTLEIIEMPRFQAGRAMAYNDQPPALEPDGKSFYAVTPFLESWDESYIESFLREYNDRMLMILTIHEAYPGHYVEGWYAAKNPSTLRKIHGSGTFAEGWAVYTETVMLDAGFRSDDPGFAIQRYKWLLRSIANAIIDQKLHKGEMTDEELVGFLMEQAFQERTEAEAKLTRAKLTYGQLSTYFVGFEEHMDLRADYQAQAGDAFNMSDYHVNVVSQGAPPVHLVRELILP